jgi:hypothetical protein
MPRLPMMAAYLALAVLSTALFRCIGEANADACARLSEVRLGQLSVLVGAWMGQPAPASPAVVYWTAQQVRSRLVTNRIDAVAAQITTPVGSVLVLPCRPEADAQLEAYALHELTHVAQRAAGEDPTTDDSEWHAERVAARYLRHPNQ